MYYQEYLKHCLETWGGNNKKERCPLAIIEEVGEVVGKYQKLLRGDYKESGSIYDNTIKFKEDICKEFGDVLFYITVMIYQYKQEYDLEDFDIDFDDVVQRTFDVDLFKGSNGEAVKNCAFRIINNLWSLERSTHKDTIFRGMYAVVLQLAYKKFMLTPDDIISANIKKLQDRKQRNVINGSGDNR